MNKNIYNIFSMRAVRALVLGLMLLTGFAAFGQTTIINETFGTAASGTYTGGTSSPSVTYTATLNTGVISTALASSDGYLNLVSGGTTLGRPNLTAPFSSLSLGSFTTTLASNTAPVVWTVNMRASRLTSSNSGTSYSDGTYYLAVVLCSNSGNLITTPTGTNGYALILQRKVGSTTQNAIRLVRFTNGLISGSGGTPVGTSATTLLAETPALAGAPPTSAAPNNMSIKVVYTPTGGTWELFYREDAGTTFVDPTSGTLTSAGTAVADATYTGTAMTHFGYLGSVSTSSAVGNQLQIDNFKIALNNPTINAPSVSSLSGFTATNSTASSEKTFTISGQYLTNSIVVTAPGSGDYEISTTSGSGFGATATITNAATQSATIYVRLKSGLADGSKTGNITIASTGATTTSSYTVALTGSVASTPTLTPSTASLTQFANTAAGANSASSNFTLSGVNLSSGNVTVTAPANFAVSTDNTTFSSSVTITPSSGAVSSTISVRYSPTGSGGYSGNVVIAWTGLADQNVAVSGYLPTFYYKGVSVINDPAAWSGTSDGTGTSVPTNFTTANITYKILTNATTDAVLTVSGTGSKVIVGDPSVSAVTLTVASGFGITGTVDVAAASSGSNSLVLSDVTSTTIVSPATVPPLVLGTLHASSEVHIHAGTSGSQMPIPYATYGKLIIDDGYAGISQPGPVTTVGTVIQTSLTVGSFSGSTAILALNSSANYFVINTGATVTVNGFLKIQRLPGAVSFSVGTVGTSFGSLQFKDAYNSGTPNFVLAANSTVEFGRTSSGSTSTQAISLLPSGVSYANLTISDGAGTGQTVTKTFANGSHIVNGIFTINQIGTGASLSSINLNASATLTVNGSVVLTSGTLTGSQYLTIGNGATVTRTAGAFDAAPTFGATTNVTYNGTTAVTSGFEMPASGLNNLTINNTGGVTLASSLNAAGTLTLTAGKVTLGANNLTVGSISGGSSTAYVVTDGAGALIKTGLNALFTFPIGTASTYDPVAATPSAATDFSARVASSIDPTHTLSPAAQAVCGSREWHLTSSNPASTVLAFTPGDGRAAPAGSVKIGHWNGAAWDADIAATYSAGTFTGTASAFSPFIVGEAQVSLPVELSNFQVKRSQTSALLTWTTASEKNNALFNIEQSTNGTDFQTVGQVKGYGTTSVSNAYNFEHATPSVGVNYYRLKQVDFNGATSFSAVRSVVFGKIGLVVKSTLVQDAVNILTSDDTMTPLSIFNVAGQQVLSMKVQGEQSINVSHLPAGLYIIRTATGEAGRFVKQ